MVASPAISMLFAVITVFACAETAAAKAARSRHPAALHSVFSHGQAAQRQKPPLTQAPSPGEKAWMERASAPSNGAGGGGGM
jgi:hypothetical protein